MKTDLETLLRGWTEADRRYPVQLHGATGRGAEVKAGIERAPTAS
jgi:hypothetical protein